MNQNLLLSQVQVRPIAIVDLLTMLSVAFIIGLVIVAVYRATHRGLNYERSFLLTLVLTAPIVGLVMLLIGSNLALSLGLVGALSIIRFRNVLRDSRDMIYLFWAIAIGLGCGTSNLLISAVASAFIGGVLLLLYYLQFGKARQSDSILVVTGTGEAPSESLSNLIHSATTMASLRSLEVEGGGWEIVYELRIPSTSELDQHKLLREIRQINGVERASLMAPNLSMPI